MENLNLILRKKNIVGSHNNPFVKITEEEYIQVPCHANISETIANNESCTWHIPLSTLRDFHMNVISRHTFLFGFWSNMWRKGFLHNILCAHAWFSGNKRLLSDTLFHQHTHFSFYSYKWHYSVSLALSLSFFFF